MNCSEERSAAMLVEKQLEFLLEETCDDSVTDCSYLGQESVLSEIIVRLENGVDNSFFPEERPRFSEPSVSWRRRVPTKSLPRVGCRRGRYSCQYSNFFPIQNGLTPHYLT